MGSCWFPLAVFTLPGVVLLDRVIYGLRWEVSSSERSRLIIDPARVSFGVIADVFCVQAGKMGWFMSFP